MLKKLGYCLKCYARSTTACWLLAVYFALTVFSGYANVRFNQSVGFALADYGNLWARTPIVAGWCAVWGISNIVATIALFWSSDYSFTAMYDLMAEQLLSMKYGEYVKYSPAYIDETATACHEMVDGTVNLIHSLGNLFRLVVLFFGVYQTVPQMVPFYAIFYVIGGVLVFYSYTTYDRHIGELRKAQRTRNKELEECINGFSEVRGFCTQPKHLASIKALNAKAFSVRVHAKFQLQGANSIFTLLEITGIVLAIRYLVGTGDAELAVASGTGLIMTIMNMSYALNDFLASATNMVKDTMHVEDFSNLMKSEREEIADLRLDGFDNTIEFQDVSFGYDSTSTVLEGINLTIHKGEKIGICGLSGGGKSTLLKLLPKFYAPTKGTILVDGIDINRIESSSLRSTMGIVSQDPHLFDASIRENVSYGTNATDVEIVEACKKANLYDFIDQLPDRFDTIVGPRGFKLSGGQKQRISLARVFLKNPEIVLLDEATSALDNESESIVKESLEQLQGKTVITVAHRLTTIQNSDRILVIDNHRIAEEGTHLQLLKQDGIYTRLAMIGK